MSTAPLTPEEALDKLFTVISEEAIANPRFSRNAYLMQSECLSCFKAMMLLLR